GMARIKSAAVSVGTMPSLLAAGVMLMVPPKEPTATFAKGVDMLSPYYVNTVYFEAYCISERLLLIKALANFEESSPKTRVNA
ncbi:hypothetical protein QP445_11770, partial [Micrococcus luteus]|nr:hypothetical protein [Micrococcus luteus]